MTTVSETLYRAADLIEERGWIVGAQGWPGSGLVGGALCLEGGIMAALGEDFLTVDNAEFSVCPAYVAVQHYLNIEPGLTESGSMAQNPLYRFNDAPERTAAEVVETLRAAATIAAAREVDVRVVTSA